MVDERQCNECGGKLPADVPQGLCPQCLMKLGLPSEAGAERRAVSEEQRAIPTSATPPGGFVPPEPDELAKKFPQLEILELLGQGGMGAVYKARQRQLDRLVALKVLPPEAGRDPAFAERFAREARSLAKLNHPGIVSVFDFGHTEDGVYYFIMEFVDGTDLRRVIEGGQLDPAEALAIVPQICEALQYAHEEGLVHRDIKPENILLDKKGRVKIADFGLAKLLGKPATAYTLTQAGQRMGTPHYMAPEQIEGAHEVDHRADIYSLGVVFYEMLTGELPIGRFAPPSQKVQVDVRLDEIVLHTLEKEPERRYQHAGEVKTDVEQIRSTSGPSAPPAALLVGMSPGRSSVRRRVPLLLKLAVWSGVVVGACLYLMPLVMMEWWPWVYNEHWEIGLAPQSGAYQKVTLRADRRLYCRGQNPDRLISKSAWAATAKIGRSASDADATLELDPFREKWSWTVQGGERTGSHEERQPRDVVDWMKSAGIDVGSPGIQEEAAELIRLLKDAANGVPPGAYDYRSGPESVMGTKVGPFTVGVPDGWGIFRPRMVGLSLDDDRNQVERRWVIAVVFLAIWLPGIVIIVRRHRRRPTAAADHPQTAMKTPVYKQVSAPAVALFVAGLLTFARAVESWWGLTQQGYTLDPSDGKILLYDWPELLYRIGIFSAIPAAFIMVLGAVSMRRLQSRGLVLAGAILAFVPFTGFTWLITMPIGIWVLSVLAKAEVKAGFPGGRRHSEVNGDLEPVQKQTDQTDTDERTDQMNTNSKSNIGTMSLVLAIGGTVLSIAVALLLALIESLTNFMPPYTLCFVLFVALEIAALVTGIIGWRSPCGKAGLIISAILLLLSSIALPVSRVSWRPSEVGRFGDTSQNDNE